MDGAVKATVTSVTDTSVSFTPPELPAGDYNIIVHVSGSGNAEATDSVLTSEALVDAITPEFGSVCGGQTVVITGNGFSGSCDDTSVTIDGNACECQSVTAGSVTCVTPAGAAATFPVEVISNGKVFPTVDFTYSDSDTPTVTICVCNIY